MRRAFLFGMLAIGAIVAAAFIFPAPVTAQSTSPADCVVKLGEYKDLDFWKQLKIGAAEFVNPSLFKTSAIAYRYDPAAFKDKLAAEDMVNYLRSGRAALANSVQDKWVIYKPGTPQFDSVIAGLKDNPKWGTAKWGQYVFVAPTDRLLDVAANGTVVSWDATQPVAPGLPSPCGSP